MIETRRRLAGPLALLLAAALVPLACRGKEGAAGGEPGKEPRPAASSPRRGGTAVVATTADFNGVNELIVSGTTTTLGIHLQLFLQLLREQPDFEQHPPTLAPSLARSYDWSPDHKVLTFHLRDDVTWSDGAPVTAEDVRWTWQAQVDPAVAWTDSYFKRRIRDVEVVDPHTVRFHFEDVYATQLSDANEGFILPKHAWEKVPFSQWRQSAEFFRQHLVTDGPFELASWRPQEEIVLTRNPHYYEPGLPRLDRVVIRVVPVPANQVTQLLTGAADFLMQVPIADIPRLEKSDHVRPAPYWGRRFVGVLWNTRRPLFADPEVRRALTLATDRQTLVDTLWGRYARVAASPIISTAWATDRTIKPWPYDPVEARRILTAKGWQDSNGDGVLDRGGKPFAFELLSNQGNAERAAATVMLQEQLRKVGIAATPRIAEFNTLVDQLERHDFDAVVTGYGIPTSLDLEYAFHSRSIEGSSNWGAYSNPEVDRLIDEIPHRPDLAAAAPLFHDLQKIIHRDQPLTLLWESQDVAGVGERLEDVRPNALSPVWNLKEWWIRPAK